MDRTDSINESIKTLQETFEILGEQIADEERTIIIKGTILGELLGEQGLDGEDVLNLQQQTEITMEALTLVEAKTEKEYQTKTLELVIKIIEMKQASPDYETYKILYAGLGVDIDAFLEAQLKMFRLLNLVDLEFERL